MKENRIHCYTYEELRDMTKKLWFQVGIAIDDQEKDVTLSRHI